MGAAIGRERELGLGDAFLGAAAERSTVLLLEGEAGIGKTTLWQEVLRRASSDGFRVLSCRPAEAETKYALATVSDLIESVDEEIVAALPDPQRRALEVALLRAAPGRVPPDQRAVATAVRSLLAALADDGPLLVAVDDLQWVDPSSAGVVEFALRRLTGVRAGWLFSRRVGEDPRLDVSTSVPAESLTRVTLGPLTLAALHHVIKLRLGRPLPRAALVRVHQSCDGNPFYALEIARELLRAQEPVPRVIPVREDFERLLSKRIRRLPAETREALLAASALSEPTTSLVDERALAPAEDAELVRVDGTGRVVFRHPLYASAVYGSASRTRRREVHARLADGVGDLEERARHLALARAAPSEAVAAELDAAARRAAGRGAPYAAAELAELAAGLTPVERSRERRRRRLSQAEYLFVAGDAARARAVCEQLVAELSPGAERAEVLVLLADIREDDLDAALLLAEQALSDAAADPLLSARAHGLVATVLLVQGELRPALSHRLAGVAQAERAGDPGLLALLIGHTAHTESLLGRYTPGLLERGLRVEEEHGIVPDYGPTFAAGLRAMYRDRLDEARSLLGAVRRAAAEAGDEARHGYVLMHLGELECRACDLDAAERVAAEALERAEQVGLQHSEAGSLYVRALTAAMRGDVAMTRKLAGRGLELVGRNGIFFVQLESVLGFLELSAGDAAAAAQHLRALPPLLERMGYGEPSVNRVLPNAIEALVQLGELDEARPLVDRLEERGRALDSPWSLSTGARCRGLLRAADGDLDGALDALAHALAAHDRMPGELERGRTLLVKGMVERRARRRAHARQSFEKALETFERVGATLWAERARRELERIGLRRSVGDELTDTERGVAALAAQGLTNRDVAAALFISPKTVEANLSRVYRKLGISSRAELGARMAEAVQT
jgi:DNA-binding CsgD family transcriptional regulator